MGKFLLRYMPVILWMILMFSFSARSDLPVNGTVAEDFFSKKFAHVLEYILLMLLMYRAVGIKNPAKAFLFSLIYAFSDEIHQLFTPYRSGNLWDVGIDSIGLVISTLIIIKLRLWNSFLLLAPLGKLKQ